MKADERLARRLVRERSGGDCEVRIPGVCLGQATNFMHRRGRGQGGPWTASNGLHGCGSGSAGCHGWITAHPAQSWRNGWYVKSWQNWASTPVALGYRHNPAILLDDGTVRDATDEELIACISLGFGVDMEGRI